MSEYITSLDISLPVGKIGQEALARAPWYANVTVDELVSRFKRVPAQTAIVGVCDDGMPVLLDLTDPCPGAIGIIGDDHLSRMQLLKTMVLTSTALNMSDEVKYLTITSSPENWSRLKRLSHCIGIVEGYRDEAYQWVLRIEELIAERYTGRQNGAAVFLIIDDFRFVAEADAEIKSSLQWILENGPQVQVWPVVSMAPTVDQTKQVWLSRFSTKIAGYMDPLEARQLKVHQATPSRLTAGRQFSVKSKQSWLPFWLPVDAN
jgi:hypothetical protein